MIDLIVAVGINLILAGLIALMIWLTPNCETGK